MYKSIIQNQPLLDLLQNCQTATQLANEQI